jgi:hypothetical protein
MTHTTTIGRAILAMLVGALVGGNLSMGLLIAGFGAPEPGQTFQIWLIMQAYWLGGILIFAAIPFILMHISNLRQWYGMTFVGVITMVMLAYYAFKGIQSNGSLVALVIIGGVVGWAIWRVAYRRTALEG